MKLVKVDEATGPVLDWLVMRVPKDFWSTSPLMTASHTHWCLGAFKIGCRARIGTKAGRSSSARDLPSHGTAGTRRSYYDSWTSSN